MQREKLDSTFPHLSSLAAFAVSLFLPLSSHADGFDGSLAPPPKEQYAFLNQISSNNTVNFRGDLLFWKGQTDGLDFAYSFVETGGGSGANYTVYNTDRKIHRATFPANLNYRVSAGYARDSWDTLATFTHYLARNDHSMDRKRFQPDGSVGPIVKQVILMWPTTNIRENFESLKARYHLGLNCYDWEFGKSIPLNSGFLLRPLFGLRLAFLQQKLKTIGFTGLTTGVYKDTTRLTQSFRGLGPKLGLDAKFFFYRFFSIYTQGVASLLASKFYVTHRESQIVVPPAPDGAYKISSDSDFNKVVLRASLDLAAGLTFGYNIGNSRRLEINGGYQFSYWPRQNIALRYFMDGNTINPVKHPGDVLFHGWTLQGSYEF